MVSAGQYVTWQAHYSWPPDPLWAESNWPDNTPWVELYMAEPYRWGRQRITCACLGMPDHSKWGASVAACVCVCVCV